jgi:rod shape-determining protein MreC
MAVVAQGSLAGRITSVSDSSAQLLPVQSPLSSVNVVAQAETTAADGVVDGDGSGGLVMRHIEPTEAVAPGDFVVTSGLGGGFPRGIPVGRVLEVGQSAASVFRHASVEPFVRTDRLDVVQIIVGQQPEA